MGSIGKRFMHSREGYFGVLFLELQNNEGNKDQNNTCLSASAVHSESTYII